MKTKHFIQGFLGSLLFITLSCSDDDNKNDNDQELITTVEFTLTSNTDANLVTTFSFRDLDGDGPNPPVIERTGAALQENHSYSGSLRFLNELETPVEDITEEIEEEDDEHQIFYQIASTLGTFSYVDFDVNGGPVGLRTTFLSGNAGSGNLRITLRHKPNKNAVGVASGDITNAGGETDIEVDFEIQLSGS